MSEEFKTYSPEHTHENFAEKYGRNVRIVNYWNRHAQKESAEGYDPATGQISKSGTSKQGFIDSIQFGKKIKASKQGVLRTYVSNIYRTTETAEGILRGYKERNPGAVTRKIVEQERLFNPDIYPNEFWELYNKKFGENKNQLMVEKGQDPADFDKLSPNEQADIAETAEEPVIKEWLRKGSELNTVFDPAEVAKDFGRLFYFHNVRIPGLVYSGSEIDLMHVSHHAVMEPILTSGVLIREKDGKRITSLEDIERSLYLLEGWKSITEVDADGKIKLIIELRGDKYNVDMEMLKEMGKPQKQIVRIKED